MADTNTRGDARSALRHFLASEAAGGILLIATAILALIVANSGLHHSYEAMLHAPIGPDLSSRHGPPTVHFWINDGLMAVFFLLVGLEIKREFVDGRLSTWDKRRLPVIAAAVGMLVPALIYLAVAAGRPELRNGWAIPAATDIAFAIGVLALLGKRAPTSLKLFLTTVAIADDLGAVAIIALALHRATEHAGARCRRRDPDHSLRAREERRGPALALSHRRRPALVCGAAFGRPCHRRRRADRGRRTDRARRRARPIRRIRRCTGSSTRSRPGSRS